jgi:mycothiol synthase
VDLTAGLSERFSWRSLNEDQVRPWLDMLAAVEAADQVGEHFGEADLVAILSGPNMDLARGSIAVYDGDAMVADALLESAASADPVHQMRMYADVHPRYRGLGIGSALLAWAEQAALPLHDERFGGRPLALNPGCLATNSAALDLLSANGYRPVRWFNHMVCSLARDLAEAPVPPGVQVVAFTSDRLADARLIRNEAFRDHWGSTQQSMQAWEHRVREPSFRPRYSFLAYADGEPLSLVLGREYDAHTQATGQRELYVATVATRRVGRGRGIASALIARALTAAKADGFGSASLDVDADSMTGALGVYQRLGFAVQLTSVAHEKALIS